MSNARAAILARLREAPVVEIPDLPTEWTPYVSGEESAKDRFMRLMIAVRGEVIEIKRADFVDALKKLLAEKGANNLLYGPGGDISTLLAGREAEIPQLLAYDRPIEDIKEKLFTEIDAGLTSTKGGIADTGSLIVWPSSIEPRLLSLVPPLHIAVLEQSKIVDSFSEAVSTLRWSKEAPANALLISGPSKTADIEGILCFGVHGPKQLVVLLIID